MRADCPACHGSASTHLGTVGSQEAAQHFVLREADPERHTELRQHIEALWQGSGCCFMSCPDCGFGFAFPFVAGDARFYELAYPDRRGYPTQRWEFDRTLAALSNIEANGSSALEIGGGVGAFLDRVSPRLFPSDNVVAVEYSDKARGVLSDKGFHAVGADIRDPAFPRDAGPFDFVFMFQVLEHMDEIDAVFDRLRELTTATADIFIAVPNPRRIAFTERHGGPLDMPPNHIGRWTTKAFLAVARRHGFLLVETALEDCRLPAFAMQDTVSRYLRRAMVRGSLSNRVRSRRRRIVELAMVAGIAPSRIGTWLSAMLDRRELGATLWVHLQRRRSSKSTLAA